MAERKVVVLGSTGSIGRSALEVVSAHRDRLRVEGLSAHRRWRELAEQARATGARRVAIADRSFVGDLRRALEGSPVEVLGGSEGVEALARGEEVDVVLLAVVGAAALPIALAALEAGKVLAMANKEALVMAGPLIIEALHRTGASLIPVDSEHSAVFQAMRAGRPREVERIIITASGGPFYRWDAQRAYHATVEEALEHPTWSMGPKVTIDSATLMNKALEVVEARWLFQMEPERIEVLIHPEAVVHAVVVFRDGSALAQMSVPDMRIPIQYALTYPERRGGLVGGLDLAGVGRLHFERPDLERFPALRLGYRVAREGKTLGAVLNAANETAVDLFLRRRIPLGRIVELVEEVLRRHRPVPNPTLEDILQADRWAREEVLACC